MELSEMTRDERSLLLFFETCVVDFTGRVDTRRMNQQDEENAKRWNNDDFIGYGRIVVKDHNSQGSRWVEFTDDAWALAHQERRARHARNPRRYTTTAELNA